MKSNKMNKLALMCAASVVALTAGARAQQQNVEQVTVTGSRVISDITLSPTPITAVSAEQLQSTTPTTIPDALNKLPDFYGNQTSRNQGNGSGNGSSNTLNLRNLGQSRTLVLLDGQRIAPSNQGGTVDVDTLPQMLVSRVDIVTGGASAVYGSDAVAGVVNFILDKKFTGFKYDINAGISKYTDAAEERIGIAWGTDLFGGRGHYEMSARVFQQDMIPIASRPYGYQGNAWVQPGSGTAADPFVDVPFGRLFNQSLNGTIKCGNGITVNGVVQTLPCTLNNYTFGTNGQLMPLTHGIPTTLAGLESGGDGGYADPVDTTYQARQRQGEFFNRFSYDITDHVNAYIQASASEAADYSRWTPLLVSAAGSRPNTFFTNNAYLSPQQQQQLTAAATAAGNFVPAPKLFTPPTGGASSIAPAVPANTPFFSDAHYINKIDGQHAYLGDNIYATKGLARNLNLTAGLDGDFSGFAWKAFYSHQESRVTVVDPQNTNNARWMASQDAVIAPAGLKVNNVDVGGSVQCWVTTQPQFAPLYPGCVPVNVFDPVNGISQAAYNYIKQPTFWSLTQQLDNLGGSISGGLFGLGLPAGEITGALSAEMRWRTYFNKTNALPTDFVNCTGLRMCTVNGGAAPALWTQNVNAPQDSSDDVWETALEFNIPVLKDFPLAEDLNVDIAGRHTSYSISGDADSWKIGVNDRISETFRLRGTMSYDIRAPNLNDLFQPVGISSTGFNDLLTKANNSTQLVQQGNPGLTPEVAHTYTLGLVVTPSFVPGLVASLDYYQTHMANAITGISYQNTTVQNLCIASAPTYSSPFCALAIRPFPVGSPQYTTTSNYPTQVLSSPVNSAKVQMEGWNLEIDYNWDWADVWDAIPGSMTLRHLINYTPVLQTQNLPGTSFQWTAQPKTRMTTFLSYQVGDWGFDIQNRWLSGWKKATLPGQVYVVPRITSSNVTDFTINKRFDMWGGSSSLYFNIQNIANTRAPLQGANPSVPGLFYPSPTQYSDVGRYFTIGLKGNF